MVRIETVKTDSGEMKCTVFGTGARPMVIIPGLSVGNICDCAEQVASAYGAFCEDYTVYLFDRCTDIPNGYTMGDMSEAAADGMRALGIENACIFGASQGGMIALYLAERHSELVRCLAVCSTSALIRDDFKAVCENWKSLAAQGDSAALTAYFNSVLYSDRTLEEFGDMLLSSAPQYSEAELARFIRLAEAFDSLDIKSRLDDIKCSVLVLAAMSDRVSASAPPRSLPVSLAAR